MLSKINKLINFNKLNFRFLSSELNDIYESTNLFPIKYGLNPHQQISVYKNKHTGTNIKLLNGFPSYINYLDAIQSWNLVSSIKKYDKDKIVSTSFKHTTPTGLCVTSYDYNNISKAFVDSRNIDPLSSFGDFIAISDIIDKDTALLIKNVVSYGIIAKGYTEDAFNILKRKKKDKYIIFKGDINNYFYESRELNGLKFIIEKNNYVIDNNKINELFKKNKININKNLIDYNKYIKTNLQLAYNILSYIPSNSISIAYDNKVIGVGAGQQNRVDCIKIAGEKAKNYLERQGKKIEKTELILGSDGFLPFEDNIEECIKYNIKYIIQPGGSIRDKKVKNMCNKHNIKMINTGKRMFYH